MLFDRLELKRKTPRYAYLSRNCLHKNKKVTGVRSVYHYALHESVVATTT